MALSRADVANRKKRAIYYAVEGCFSEFLDVVESKAMGGNNIIPTSNVRKPAEIKVTYWLRQETINVSVETSILKARK